MTITITNAYYTTGDWLLAVDGANGYAWRDALVTVNGESVSPLWAPSYSWSLVARDNAAAVSGAGFSWRVAWATGTTDTDPGSGNVAADSATVASITEIYISDDDGAGTDRAALLALFDNSTSTVKGQISLTNVADRTEWISAEILSITDNAGYFTLSVQNPAGSASTVEFASADDLTMGFTRTGDVGSDGDVVGPVSSTDNALMRWDGTGGNTAQNSGWTLSDADLLTAGGAVNGGSNNAYGFTARENNIGSTGSNVTLDMDAYNVWYFEPTGNIDVDVTNVPNIGSGGVLGYAVITGGGDHTLTLKCEGSAGGAKTPGGSGLTLSTTTGVDVVAIIKTGTDQVMFKVAGAAIA